MTFFGEGGEQDRAEPSLYPNRRDAGTLVCDHLPKPAREARAKWASYSGTAGL